MLRRILVGLIVLCHFFPTLSYAQIDTRNVLKVGTNALQYQEYVWAIQCFNEVITAKPYLWEPYYFRAVAKHYLDDHRGAIADCDSAIVRNPYIVDLHRLRGISCIHHKDFEQAISAYTQAITLATTPNQQDWFNRSLCYLELKQHTLAQQGFDTITSWWPKDDKAYHAKAQLALQAQDTLRCYNFLDSALARNAKLLPALATYATLLSAQQQYRDALPYYDRAIAQAPKDARLYFNRALTHYQIKRLGLAISDYDTVIILSPSNYAAHYNRALLRMQVGADNQAIEDLDVVIARKPHNTLARFNRALLHEQVGNYQHAENDLTHVLKQFPNFLYGYEVRARIRQRLGKHQAAANDRTVIARDHLARVYKGKARGKIQKVRRWEDEEIEDFDQLTLNEADSIPTYSVEYRGLIQHQPSRLRPQPLFELSFERNQLQTANDLHYIAAIESFNQNSNSKQRLYLSSVKQVTDSITYATRQELLRSLHTDSTFTQQLLRCIALGSLHRYDDAFKVLTAPAQNTYEQVLEHWITATLLQQQVEVDSITEQHTLRNIKQAIDKHYDKAIQLAPELRPYALYNTAVWYTQTNAVQEALLLYNKVIDHTALPQAYFNRGLLLRQMGKTAEAYSDLSRAGEMGLYEAYNIIKQLSNASH